MPFYISVFSLDPVPSVPGMPCVTQSRSPDPDLASPFPGLSCSPSDVARTTVATHLAIYPAHTAWGPSVQVEAPFACSEAPYRSRLGSCPDALRGCDCFAAPGLSKQALLCWL